MDMITVTAKTVDEAVTKALIELQTTSDKLEYEVVDKGSTGFLGIGSKPAIIRAKKKESIEDKAMDFLSQIFWAMNMEVSIIAVYNEEEQELSYKAAMAVYIHGLCGDIAREKKGSHGMTAKDMIEALPEVLKLAEVQSKG